MILHVILLSKCTHGEITGQQGGIKEDFYLYNSTFKTKKTTIFKAQIALILKVKSKL